MPATWLLCVASAVAGRSRAGTIAGLRLAKSTMLRGNNFPKFNFGPVAPASPTARCYTIC
jgi:hypothetical protein